MQITLDLTLEEAAMLEDCLVDYKDKGTYTSTDFANLSDKVCTVIDTTKTNEE